MWEAKPHDPPGQHRPLCLHFLGAWKTQGCAFEVHRNCRSSVNKQQFIVHFQKTYKIQFFYATSIIILMTRNTKLFQRLLDAADTPAAHTAI